MPIIVAYILEGRDAETKKKLIGSVTSAVVETLKVPVDSVRVIINEMAHDHYGIAGLPVLEHRRQKSKKPGHG